MKKLRLRHLVFLIIISIFIFEAVHFFYPIRIQQIISQENIDKIYISYVAEGKTTAYLVQMNHKSQISEMMSILDSISYTRGIRSGHHGTYRNCLYMTIVNRDLSNYSMDISEDGKLVSTKRLFQARESFESHFNDLVEWMEKYGTVQPIEQIDANQSLDTINDEVIDDIKN